MGRSSRGSDAVRGRSIERTARDHLRAIAGGLLVGLPLLWTMEVWEIGAILSPVRLLVLFACGFAIVVGYNAISGFRRERTWSELLIDAVQGMGLSVVIAAAALFVLGRLEPGLAPGIIAGRVALEAIPVAFGTSLAATVLSDPEEQSDGAAEPTGPFGRLLVAAGGALYFALNVAPTEEVRIVGAEADWPLLLLAIAVSLVVGLAIVFHAEFPGGRSRDRGDSPLDGPYAETLATYVLALAVSLGLLWAFGTSDGLSHRAIVGQAVMLGVVASFGAAAGRLLLGGGPQAQGGPSPSGGST